MSFLEVKGLKVCFRTLTGEFEALKGIDYSLEKGRVLGLVGESGSGKSMSALAIMGLIPKPNGYIKAGQIIFDNISLCDLSEKEYLNVRGNRISMIFQEPMTSLNPVFRVGDQITETILIHNKIRPNEAKKRAMAMLDKVQIPNVDKTYYYYPHQLSGGMRQRIMIAMAICTNPDLLICDEPTTALDVTIQADILKLMKQLVASMGLSIIFISHDLGVINYMCDDVCVMYGGRVVEKGVLKDVLRSPQHRYTKGLIKARPENYSPEHGFYTMTTADYPQE